MDSPTPEQASSQAQSSSAPTKREPSQSSSSSGSGVTSTLKRLSYKEAADALSPGAGDPRSPVSGAGRQLSFKEAADKLSPFGGGGSAQSVAEAGLKGASKPADAAMTSKVAEATGVDVSHARAHTGPEAQAACDTLGAQAYTVGSDVAFGTKSPSASLQAHEYAHVAQQTGVPTPAGQAKGSPALKPSGDLEAEADAVADAVTRGESAPVSQGVAPQIAKRPKDFDPDSREHMDAAFGAEMKSIYKYLKGKTSDGDVSNVCRIMSHWDIATIGQVWARIKTRHGAEWIDDFIDNVSLEHFRSYSREIYATLKAVDPKVSWKLALDLTDTGIFNGVSEEEAWMTFLIMRTWPSGWVKQFRERCGERWKEFTENLPRSASATLSQALDQKKEQDRKKSTDRRKSDAVGESEAKKTTGSVLAKIQKDLDSGIFNPVTDDEARRVLRELGNLSGAALRTVVRSLEEKGYIDKWLDNLPAADKFSKPNVNTVLAVMRCRPPEAALHFAESLVSYGLFDWAIREEEAQMAYYLIRSQPPSVQARFREKDNGKWLERMERHLGREVANAKTQVATVDEEGNVIDDAGFGTFSSQQELDDSRKGQALLTQEGENGKSPWDTYTAIEKKFADGAKDAASFAYTELKAVPDTLVRQAMVRRLDALGHVEQMVEDLGYDFVWSDANRLTTLTILAARDPMRSVAHIVALLDTGFLGMTNVVSSSEAYLAYNLLKAMPKAVRDRVTAENPDWWSQISGEMSDAQLNAADTNMYSGGKDGADRASLVGQLADPELWESTKKEDVAQLENVLRMAHAASHRKLCWEMARKFDGVTKHPQLMHDFGLDTEEYTDAIPKNRKWYQEGALQTVAEVGTMVGQGIDAYFQTDDVTLKLGHSDDDRPKPTVNHKGKETELKSGDMYVGVKGLELDEVQDVMGGNLMGMSFARTDGDKKNEDGTDNAMHDGVNAIDATYVTIDGVTYIEVDAPHLVLDRINSQFGDYKLETGAVTIKGLKLLVEYDLEQRSDKRDKGARNGVIFKMESASVADLMVVTADSMVAMQTLDIKGVDLKLQETPVAPAEAQADGKTAAKEGLKRLDVVPNVLGQAASGAGQGKDPAKAAKDSPMAGMKIAEVTVTGLSTSAGVHADKIALEDIDVALAAVPSEHAANRMAQLDKQLAADAKRIAELEKLATRDELQQHELDRLKARCETLTADKAKLEAEIPKLKEKEAKYDALYARQRAGEDLGDEMETFLKLQKELQGGVTMDVGSVQIEGMGMRPGERTGKVTATGIHGHGSSPEIPGLTELGKAAHATVATSQEQHAKDTADPDAVDASGSLTLGVDHIHGEGLTLPGSLVDYKGQHKRLLELRKRDAGEPEPGKKKHEVKALDLKEKKELADLEKWWVTKVKGRVVSDVVTELLEQEQRAAAGDPDAVLKVRELQDVLREAPVSVANIDVRGAELTVDGGLTGGADKQTASGSVSVSAGEISASGITQGSKEVKSVTATDVKGSVSTDALDIVSGEMPKGTMTGGLSAGTLTMSGYEDKETGQKLEKVRAEGLDVGVDTSGDGELSLKLGKLEVTRLRTDAKADKMAEQIAELEKAEQDGTLDTEQADKLKTLRAEMEKYRGLQADVKALTDEIVDLKAKLEDSPNDEALKAKAEEVGKKLSEAEGKLAEFEGKAKLETFTLSGVDTKVTGLGNPLEEGWTLAGRTINVSVGVKQLGISGLRYETASQVMQAESLQLPQGLNANVEASFKAKSMKKDEVTGKDVPDEIEMSAGTLHLLKVPEFSASKLKLKLPVQGELVQLEIPQAGLKGLEVTDIPLVGFDPLAMTGKVSLDEANMKLSAQVGDYFKAGGDVSVKGLKMGVLDAKHPELLGLSLDDLSLTDLGFSETGEIPKGSMVHSLRGRGVMIKRLAGANVKELQYNRDTGAIDFDLGLQTLSLGQIAWDSGKHSIGIDGSATLKGATLRGKAELDPAIVKQMMESEDPDAKFEPLKELNVKLLKVDRLDGSGIHYKDTSTGDTIDLPSGYLEGVRVIDYLHSAGTYTLKVNSGGVTDLAANFSSAIEKDGKKIGTSMLSATASGNVSGITVVAASDGKTRFDIDKASASNTSVTMESKDAAGKTTSKTEVENAGGTLTDVSGSYTHAGEDKGDFAITKGKASDVHADVTSENADSKTTADLSGAGASNFTYASDASAGTATTTFTGGHGTVDGTYLDKKTGDNADFNLSVAGASGSFSQRPDGFAATVDVGTVALGATKYNSFVAGQQLGVDFRKGGVLSGLKVDIDVTNYTGKVAEERAAKKQSTIKTLKVKRFYVPTATVNDLHVTWGDLDVVIPTGTLTKLDVKDLEMSGQSGKLLPTSTSDKDISLQQASLTGFSANYGDLLKASGNTVVASGLSIDLLSDGNYGVSLDDIVATAPHIQIGDKKSGNWATVDLKKLALHKTTYDSKSGDVDVKTFEGEVDATGQGTSYTSAATTKKAATHKTRMRLQFLDNLEGVIAVGIPIGNGMFPIAIPIIQSQAAYEKALGAMADAASAMVGPMARAIPYNARKAMVEYAAKAIADAVHSAMVAFRKFVESKLEGDNAVEQAAAETVSADAIAEKMMTKMGRAGRLALDSLAPGGRGLLGSVSEEVGQRVIGLIPVVGDDLREESEAQQWERRKDVLLDWIKKITIGINAKANGNFGADKKQITPPGPWQPWLDGQASATLKAGGNLENDIVLDLKTTLTGLKVMAGGMEIGVDKVNTGANASVGMDGSGALNGDLNTGFDGEGIHIKTKPGGSGSGPNPGGS